MSIDPGFAAAVKLEPGQYPRAYRLATGSRWTTIVLAIAVAAIGAVIAWPSNASGTDEVVLRIVIPVSMFALAIWLATAGLRTRLILAPDSLAYRGALLSRRMAAADIRGRRDAQHAAWQIGRAHV